VSKTWLDINNFKDGEEGATSQGMQSPVKPGSARKNSSLVLLEETQFR
jgi:hypothetical protein